MGENTKADVVSMRLADGDKLDIEGVSLDVIYTPGHTDDSYSFTLDDRVFTGDTLLIRGTGRTDFQNGDARAQYDSIFNRLLRLPDDTLVYPAHDYKGDTVSTIGEERRCNPRLQVKSVDEYVALMNNLNLPNPKMMDVAVPANMQIGLAQDAVAQKGWAVLAADAMSCWAEPDVVLVDLREKSERERHGAIPGALHEPYPKLRDNLGSRRTAQGARGERGGSSSIAPMANARPWRFRPRRRRASRRPATSRAASPPGRLRAGRWNGACKPAANGFTLWRERGNFRAPRDL